MRPNGKRILGPFLAVCLLWHLSAPEPVRGAAAAPAGAAEEPADDTPPAGEPASAPADPGRFSETWPPGGVPLFELPDTIMVQARRYGYGSPQVELLYDYLRPGGSDSLLRRPSAFALRPRTMELSRFGCVAYGADLGAATALNLGGLGYIFGLWDEKTALTMMGAGAALGALWGGTLGSENSKFRIRIDARPDER